MTGNSDSLQQQLRALREDFFSHLPSRIDAIKTCWERTANDANNEQASQELYRLVHNLFGSSASYGFETLSEASLALETRLKEMRTMGLTIGKTERPGLAGLVMDLQQAALVAREVELEDEPPVIQQTVPPPGHLVYVVDDDPDVLKYLALQLGHRGFKVRTFNRPGETIEAARAQAPTIVIMDVMFPEGDFAGPDAIAAIRRASQSPFGVIFLSSRGDMDARVRAMHAGGDAYLTKPVDIAKLVDKIGVLGRRATQRSHRVLIIDDDRSQVLLFKAILEKAGMWVTTVTDPMQVMQTLDQERPDLVLVDLYMPGVDGLDLVRVLRQRDDTVEVPVIFVSGETDPAKQLQAISVGGDQFLTKPVKPDHLVTAVRTRIHRAQELKESIAHLEIQDPLTGLYNRRYLYEELEKAIRGAASGAVLYIEVDEHESIQRRIGLLNADLVLADVAKVLKATVDSDDVLARYGGWAFGLLVQEADPDALLARAAAIQGAVKQHITEVDKESLSVSCSIGISLLSPDMLEAGATISAAHGACNKAREQGGTRVYLLNTAADTQTEQHSEAFWGNRIAIALKAEGLHTFYQPIVALRGVAPGECYQALLRMQDSHGDFTDAGEFIGHAEHTGQIVDVDRWSTWNAARILAAQAKSQKSPTLFVPISVTSARSEALRSWLRRVHKALIKASVRPGSLVLELNTAAATTHLKDIQDFISLANELDIRSCLTQFGSSTDPWTVTSHLTTLYLKLDRSLVQELVERGHEAARLPAMVDQAHSLDKLVIVPYVSDAATMSTLWQCGADYVQGYFIQEPNQDLAFDFGVTNH